MPAIQDMRAPRVCYHLKQNNGGKNFLVVLLLAYWEKSKERGVCGSYVHSRTEEDCWRGLR